MAWEQVSFTNREMFVLLSGDIHTHHRTTSCNSSRPLNKQNLQIPWEPDLSFYGGANYDL